MGLRRLGKGVSVPIPADERGFTGRECPQPGCEGYFKIAFGTGLQGEGLPCFCPYCGHSDAHGRFWTREQIEYAKSVAMRTITDAIRKDLKKLEFNHKARGPLGISVSMKVKEGRRVPIHHYREKQLEIEVICVNCTLRYSVYGVFAFCPDCGQHNSLQILDRNLDVVERVLDLAGGVEEAVAERLVENALEDCVSAFDGWGREMCRVHASKSSDVDRAAKISFQNLKGAKVALLKLFDVELSSSVSAEEWHAAVVAFQKRHVVTHKMGVADPDYIRKSGDNRAVAGRRIRVVADEVRVLAKILRRMAGRLSDDLQRLGVRE